MLNQPARGLKRAVSHLLSVPVVIAAGVACAASAASAAPFSLTIVDTGGTPGAIAHPVTPSFGTFFVSPLFDPSLPPTPELVGRIPEAGFSSYAAMGGAPVTVSSFANPAAGTIGTSFLGSGPNTAAAFMGVRYTFPSTVSDPEANPTNSTVAASGPGPAGRDSVFIARLTVPRGAALVAPFIGVGVVFSENKESVLALCTLNGGATEVPLTLGNRPRPLPGFSVRSVLAAQVSIPKYGEADIYDLYVVSDGPAPGNSARSAKVAPKGKEPKAKAPKEKKPKPAKKPKVGKKAPGVEVRQGAPQDGTPEGTYGSIGGTRDVGWDFGAGTPGGAMAQFMNTFAR